MYEVKQQGFTFLILPPRSERLDGIFFAPFYGMLFDVPRSQSALERRNLSSMFNFALSVVSGVLLDR